MSYSLAYSIPLYTKDQWQAYPLLGWTAIIEKDAKDYLLPSTGNPDFCSSFHFAPKNIINASVDGKTSPKLGCHEKISTWRKMEILVILYQCTSYSTVYVPRPGRGQKTQTSLKSQKGIKKWKTHPHGRTANCHQFGYAKTLSICQPSPTYIVEANWSQKKHQGTSQKTPHIYTISSVNSSSTFISFFLNIPSEEYLRHFAANYHFRAKYIRHQPLRFLDRIFTSYTAFFGTIVKEQPKEMFFKQQR